jgi:ribose/xylose/arabinose/galactoside ABC-type transport system permease subunit
MNSSSNAHPEKPMKKQRFLPAGLLPRILILVTLFAAMCLLSALRPTEPLWRIDQYQWGIPRMLLQQTDNGIAMNWNNQLNILRQSAINIVLGTGLTLVILTGGIDLSVGSVLALANVAFVWTSIRWGFGAGAWMALAVGGLCGWACGMITVRGRVPSFITTLGMLMIARGAAHVWSGGQTIYLPTPALAVNLLPLGSALVVILIAAAMLNGSRLGRSIYAVGGNAEAAYLSGIPTNRIITLAFTMSGILAGLAGMVYWARVSSGSHLAGDGYELYAIAAAVIGGTSLQGGRGKISGTVLGALMMAVLYNGLNVLGVQESAQKMIVGAVIITAVLADRSSQ